MKFDFNEKYILEDEVIRLKPLEITDVDALLEYSINESDIWRFNADGAGGVNSLKKYIDNAVLQRQMEKEYSFIVFDKRAKKYIGSTRFYDFNFERKTLQIGFTWYGKLYQGTGINKNCKYLLFYFAFEKLNMERIGLAANSKNERSINAMKSIGCTAEGILRSYSYDARGERIDIAVLSILKCEWETEWKEKLKSKTLK